MEPIVLPKDTNYIAAFLSFACQLRCPYCINHHGGDLVKKRRMSGSDWIRAINRLSLAPGDLPVTLQGGEPTVHPDFYAIVAGIDPKINLDLLTNFMFNEDEFSRNISPVRFKRDAPYSSIRVSWHVGQNDSRTLLHRVVKMQKRGYSIGIWAVDHPDQHDSIRKSQLEAWEMGIDFRLKEFLGPHNGKEYGTFRYPDAVNSHNLRFCECRTTELLIGPDGSIYRCHSDLYAARLPVGHVLQPTNPLVGKWIPCAVYGKCNSCDIKVKTNRHQVSGHSSVAIKNVTEPFSANREFVQEVVNTYGKSDNKTDIQPL